MGVSKGGGREGRAEGRKGGRNEEEWREERRERGEELTISGKELFSKGQRRRRGKEGQRK